MIEAVERKGPELARICRSRKVARLAVFGSAATGEYAPGRSDLDFLVDFLPMPPVEYADAYFGLLHDLEELFGTAVDLVESAPIRNPFFRRTLNESQVLVYAAA
jgi:predicted nucleotidyltransferase